MTRDEALKLLGRGADGIQEWNRRRADGENIPDLCEANLVGPSLLGLELSGVDFRSAQLRGVNLRGAVLTGAFLQLADLQGANLSSAKLDSAYLGGANVGDADLHGASLRDANLECATLRGASLLGADLCGATLYSANLSDAKLHGTDLRRARLRGANLAGAKLNGVEIVDANASARDRGEVASVSAQVRDVVYQQGGVRHLELLRDGLRSGQIRGARLCGADLTGACLRGGDLRGADLVNADLRNADLTSANLSHCDLGDVDLRGAHLHDAHLREANLRRARLGDADLSDAVLQGADLSDASLGRAKLCNGDFTGAKLCGAKLNRADIRDANLHGADLQGAKLTGAKILSADFTDANLCAAKLNGADLTNANLRGVDLSGAVLNSAKLRQTNFRDATLVAAKLNRADLKNADLRGAILCEADFTEAILAGANLTEANLTRSRLIRANLSAAVVERAIVRDVQVEALMGLPVEPEVLFLAEKYKTPLTGEEARSFFIRPETVEVVLTGEMPNEAIASYHVFVAECEAASEWPIDVVFLGGRIEDARTFLRFRAPSSSTILENLSLLLQPFPLGVTLDREKVLESLSDEESSRVVERGLVKPTFRSLVAERLREYQVFADSVPTAIRTKQHTVELKLDPAAVKELRPGVVFAPRLMLIDEGGQGMQGDGTLGGDSYSAKNVQKMGPTGVDQSTNVQLIWENVKGDMNLAGLAKELRQLRAAMDERKDKNDSGQAIAVGAVAEAEEAAKRGDGLGVVGALRCAGKWAFDVSTDIGVRVTAELLKRMWLSSTGPPNP